MMKKILGVIALIILLVGVYLLIKPKPATAPQSTTNLAPTSVKKVHLDVKGNKLTNSTNKFSFTQGDTVEIIVTSDTDGEVHFHGYDKHLEAKRNQPVSLSFTLTTPGNFPFELEASGTELGTLIVNPK